MAANNTIMSAVSTTVVKKTPTWAEIEEIKDYLHGAGHAVVARLTGFPVAWVSVDPDFIQADPLAIKNEQSDRTAVCCTISSGKLNPILNRRSALNKAAKEIIIGYCMHVLAGPYSEYRFDPQSFSHQPSVNDYRQVAQVLAMAIRSNKAKWQPLYTTALRNLSRMLDENWDLVVLVAYELYRRRTIYAEELDAIMCSANQKDAA